jgi:putative aldouronate transport system permease protein
MEAHPEIFGDHTAATQFLFNTSFDVYTKDVAGNTVKVDAAEVFQAVLGDVSSSSMMTSYSSMMSSASSMNIWQELGWDSIIYFAALTSIDVSLYEAARVDGAGRWRQMWHITLPGIAPTVVILLILRIGNLMSLGWDRIYLLYNDMVMETADVISTYVYRTGMLQVQYSYATAVGLMNSIVNIVLLFSANFISRKVSDSSLW